MENKYMLEMIAEIKKELFRVEAIKKRIIYTIKSRLEKIILNRYASMIERNGNTHYSYLGYRIDVGDFLQNVKVEIYFVQNDNLTPEKIKLIEGVKKDYSDKIYFYKTGNFDIPIMKIISMSFETEKVFTDNFSM